MNDAATTRYPVVFFIFNRPEETARTFEAIRLARPPRLYVVSDGPREGRPGEAERVAECRRVVQAVDWNCEAAYAFADRNMGCRRRVNSGISWVFGREEAAVFLEDDCCPVPEFFPFVEWGLRTFATNASVGMVSGSNLIDFRTRPECRNGFSSLINIWGWGTWRRVWEQHNPDLSLEEVRIHRKGIAREHGMPAWRSRYWTELFKLTVCAGSTWDFQLQHTFFRRKLVSVFPRQNLIRNHGFAETGTHTATEVPQFVLESEPTAPFDVMTAPPDLSLAVDSRRDAILAGTIWSCSRATALRLFLMNLYRFVRI